MSDDDEVTAIRSQIADIMSQMTAHELEKFRAAGLELLAQPYRDADLRVLRDMKPPMRRPEGHFVPEDLPDSVAERMAEIAREGEEVLHVFGSGNTARDLGIPNPEATTFKWDLAGILALAMEDQNLDATAVATLAGEIEPAQIDRITRGLVRDIDSYEIMRLLKALGYRIIVDVMAPREGADGHIWISGPDDQTL